MAIPAYNANQDPVLNMLLQMRQSLGQDSERRRAAYSQAVNDVTRNLRDAEAARVRKEALALTGAEGQAYDKAHPLAPSQAPAQQAPAGPQIDPNKLTPEEDQVVSDELGLRTDDQMADDEMDNEREAVDEAAQSQREERGAAEQQKTKGAVDLEAASQRARRDVDLADFMRSYNTGYPTLMGNSGPVPEQLPPNPYTRDRDGIVTTSEMQIMAPPPQAAWSPQKQALMAALTQAAANPYGGAPPGPAPSPMAAQLSAVPTAMSVPPAVMPQLPPPPPQMAMSPAPPQYGIAEYMRDTGGMR